MAVDFLLKRDIIEEIVPNLASATPLITGAAGAWGAWEEITAGLAFPFILCGLYVMEYFNLAAAGTAGALINIQIGTGAGGAEVVRSESHGNIVLALGKIGTYGLTGRTHFVEPVVIPAGTRIAVRGSCTSAIAAGASVYLFGYDARYFGLPLSYLGNAARYIRGLESKIQGAQTWPSPGGTAVASGAAPVWTWGAWVQFIAAAANPIIITGIAAYELTAANPSMQAQIGIGAPGAEIAMSKAGIANRLGFFPFGDSYLPRPLFVKTGESVSVRVAASAALTTFQVGLKGFNLL
jgi:hypothetical protein